MSGAKAAAERIRSTAGMRRNAESPAATASLRLRFTKRKFIPREDAGSAVTPRGRRKKQSRGASADPRLFAPGINWRYVIKQDDELDKLEEDIRIVKN